MVVLLSHRLYNVLKWSNFGNGRSASSLCAALKNAPPSRLDGERSTALCDTGRGASKVYAGSLVVVTCVVRTMQVSRVGFRWSGSSDHVTTVPSWTESLRVQSVVRSETFLEVK